MGEGTIGRVRRTAALAVLEVPPVGRACGARDVSNLACWRRDSPMVR